MFAAGKDILHIMAKNFFGQRFIGRAAVRVKNV